MIYNNKSFIYTLNGTKIPFINKQYNNISCYVRKMIDVNTDYGKNEYEIAKILINNPHNNIVTILYICDKYIDIEKLDTNYYDYNDNNIKYYNNIKNSLLHLHSLNIIYIDLKDDNIGYCHSNNNWKIFDFNCSGICNNNKTEWIYNPYKLCYYYRIIEKEKYEYFINYKKYNIKYLYIYLKIILKIKKNLLKYDELIFYKLFNKFIY